MIPADRIIADCLIVQLPQTRRHGTEQLLEDTVLSASSDQEGMDSLAHRNYQWLSQFGLRREEIFMAVNEQALNYAEHSNGNDPAKQVRIRYNRQGNFLYAFITGEGDGYDVSVWFGTTPPMHNRGWGRELTKAYADGIVPGCDGKSLKLTFDLERDQRAA